MEKEEGKYKIENSMFFTCNIICHMNCFPNCAQTKLKKKDDELKNENIN